MRFKIARVEPAYSDCKLGDILVDTIADDAEEVTFFMIALHSTQYVLVNLASGMVEFNSDPNTDLVEFLVRVTKEINQPLYRVKSSELYVKVTNC